MGNSLSVAIGTDGEVVGHLTNVGGGFNARLTKWQIAIQKAVIEVSGFGDGGDSYHIQGRSLWGGSAVGAILTTNKQGAGTGTTGVGVEWLIGTQDNILTGTFDAGGKKLTGSFKMTNITLGADYRDGESVASFQFMGYGSVTES